MAVILQESDNDSDSDFEVMDEVSSPPIAKDVKPRVSTGKKPPQYQPSTTRAALDDGWEEDVVMLSRVGTPRDHSPVSRIVYTLLG